MKFTIQSGVLLDGLKSVSGRATDKNVGIAILKHIRFEVAGASLTLLAHNLSASSEAYLAVDTPADGACAVPADSVVRLIGSLPKEAHVTIEIDGLQITIKAGRSRYKLPVLLAKDFPKAIACDNAASVDLDADAIHQLFDRPQAAIDPREDRAFCMGAYVHSADGVICAAATDGKHFVRYASKASAPDLTGVIVSTASMVEIAKLGPGKLFVSDRTVSLVTPTRRYCSKLIDARFPDYTKFTPPLIENYLEVDRVELSACFQRLASIAAVDSQIYFQIEPGEIIISVAGAGEGVETVRCSSDAVPALVCGSVDQFLETTKMLDGEVLHLHISPRASSFRIADPTEPAAIVFQSTQVPRRQQAAA